MRRSDKRILAVASNGGHWRQLSALSAAFDGHLCQFVSTSAELGHHSVRDCSRSEWWLGFVTAMQLVRIIARFRPDVVVTTGALPGLIALIVARAFGARTIWIDSVANTERISLSGWLSRPFAGLWLTQWPDVSAASGAEYAGAVL